VFFIIVRTSFIAFLYLTVSVEQMHRLINQIGTSTDNPELHDKL